MPDISVDCRIDRDGFAIVDGVLSDREIDRLIDDIGSSSRSTMLRRRNGGLFGGRDLLTASADVRETAQSRVVRALVTPVLGGRALPVRAIYFDKTAAANWAVAWHQDRTIAVRRKIDVDGYGPWSIKSGVPHVEPPVAVLQNMVTVRLHLDDCGPENGPLLVVRGSHKRGRVDGMHAADISTTNAPEVCEVRRGGAMLMRPLLLHASRKAVLPGHRRVLSLDFCSVELPGGLEWQASETALLES